MVSSLCRDLNSHCPLAHGSTNILFPFQSSGEGRRVGFFPASRAAVYDSRELAGLRRYPFFNQLVPPAALSAATRRRDVIVSWTSLCFAPWGITPPTPVCVAI